MLKLLTIPLVVCSFVVLGFVFSVGYNDIYYREVTIENVHGATHLVKEYGPAHSAYPILLFA